MADEFSQTHSLQQNLPLSEAPVLERSEGKDVLSPRHIAIVEDDPEISELLQHTFEQYPHWQLTFFSDGEQASHAIPSLCPHLILLDIGLPNLDGAALYKILRGHNNTRSTPIIIITAKQDWQLHRMGLHTGLFLHKPFKLHQLLFIMRAHLGESPDLSF